MDAFTAFDDKLMDYLEKLRKSMRQPPWLARPRRDECRAQKNSQGPHASMTMATGGVILMPPLARHSWCVVAPS